MGGGNKRSGFVVGWKEIRPRSALKDTGTTAGVDEFSQRKRPIHFFQIQLLEEVTSKLRRAIPLEK